MNMKSCYMFKESTHHLHHLPAPIKTSVGGEIAILPGSYSAVPPRLLTGPESPSDSETRRKHLSGPSRCSPSSQLSSGNSPGSQPYSYADAYSEQSQLRLVNSPPISSLSLLTMEAEMDVPESRRITDGRQLTTYQGEKSEKQSVVVVVDATKELQLAALQYALEFCVHPGDNLHLLGILHQVLNPMGYKQKADSALFGGTNSNIIHGELAKKKAEFQRSVNDQELQKLFDLKQVVFDVRVCAGPDRKVVTARQALELRANWLILDKGLKKDKGYLMDKLNCRIILMVGKKEGKCIKIPVGEGDSERQNTQQLGRFQVGLELSLDMDATAAPRRQSADLSPRGIYCDSATKRLSKAFNSTRESSGASDSSTSPEHHNKTAIGYTSQLSTMTKSDTSPPRHGDDMEAEPEEDFSRLTEEAVDHQQDHEIMEGSEGEDVDTPRDSHDILNSAEMVRAPGSPPQLSMAAAYKFPDRPMSTGDLQSFGDLHSLMAKRSAATVIRPAARSAGDRAGDELMNILNAPKSPPDEIADTPKSGIRTLEISLREDDLEPQTPTMHIDNGPIGRQSKFGSQNEENRILENSSAHSRKKIPRPGPPLCSKCNHPGPVFGTPAIKFTYAELEQATKNFDQQNYLAEGGYGFVYKGELEGGQKIAVKQYKAASSQGDDEFYSEVEFLKHAQHRNLVILIGYCTDDQKRLLVYEFVCNKSLDVHLSAKNPNVLEWKSRWKIAVGAARGLRYLHEECRVGCIVHRDMRPNNILLTHDFVPMVGDFGLARSQPSGDDPEETRVIGTLGYLAPEYAESGSITEKADVYSFGVVLFELITGRKAIDATRPRGETCLTEWARPLISQGSKTNQEIIDSIVDPRLKKVYDIDQVSKMVDAAGRCISKDPDQRPRISEVLRSLERDASSGSISRVNSANDLADVPRHVHTHRESRRAPSSKKPVLGIPRLASLDSIHTAKAAAKLTAELSSSLPTTIARVAKPRRESERASSPHLSVKTSSSNSPGSKSSNVNSPHAKPKSKDRQKLSYNQML